MTGTVGVAPVVLFAVIFFWTPPHFWALAMKFKDDYAAASVPMLPVVAPPTVVARKIVLYSYAMVAATLALAPYAGWIYAASAAGLGGLVPGRGAPAPVPGGPDGPRAAPAQAAKCPPRRSRRRRRTSPGRARGLAGRDTRADAACSTCPSPTWRCSSLLVAVTSRAAPGPLVRVPRALAQEAARPAAQVEMSGVGQAEVAQLPRVLELEPSGSS